MKPLFLFIIIFFCCYTSLAQTLVFKGQIKDQDSDALSGASIILKSNEKILGFTYSDDFGRYFLSAEKQDLQEVVLIVNSLGARKREELIKLSEKSEYVNNFIMQEEIESLSTVVISSDKKIDLKRDTIVYKVSRFTDQTERTVEDVLKNIPGIEIDGNGNIKAQGRPIQKILIEGDDLADSNYKVISQNLDAQVLDKVEVISNYDENPVLKQFLSSNAVVLNLKLQEKSKSVLFGNMEAGAGIPNRYLADLNLGLIRPEIKFLNLGNLNNTGRTAGDQLNNYIFGQQGFNDFNQNFEIKNDLPVYLNGSTIMIEDRFYTENNSLANNLLLNKTLKDKTKLRASLFFYDDSFEKEYTGIYRYFVEPENIVFTEENMFHFDNLNFSNDVEVSHSISEKNYINFKNSFQILTENVQNKLIFNNEEVIDQHLKDKNINLESNLKYTRKIKGGAAVFYLYLGSKNLEQDLVIAPNTFEDREGAENSQLRSSNESNVNYQGLQADFIFKKKRLSYSLTGGILSLSEVINSGVRAVDGEAHIDSLSGSNKATSLVSNLKIKASYDFSSFTQLNSSIDAYYTNYESNIDSENFFFVNPDLNFSSRTHFGNFRIGYSYVSEVPRLMSFMDNYLVRNYRGLITGTDEIEVISKHHYSFGYTFSRPEERILFTTSLSYTDFENRLITNHFLTDDLNIAQYSYAAGQNFLLLNSGYTTYVDKISSTLKLGITHARFENPSVINNEEVVIRNQTSSIYIRGTTYFRGAYNFKFSASYSLNSGEIRGNEVSNDRYNLRTENIIKVADRVFANLKNEFFLIDSQFYETSTADIEYRPKESDWVFGFRAQNLVNTREYVFANVTDFQQTENIFEAVPRFVLLYVKVRL